MKGSGAHPLYNSVRYTTSTFFRPENFTRNYKLSFNTIAGGSAWNPYTPGVITNGIALSLATSGAMALGGNSVQMSGLTAISSSGHGTRTLQLGMVCEFVGGKLGIVSKIDSSDVIYFKNYDPTIPSPLFPAISSGQVLDFKQYGMNGISPNSAKNINFFK